MYSGVVQSVVKPVALEKKAAVHCEWLGLKLLPVPDTMCDKSRIHYVSYIRVGQQCFVVRHVWYSLWESDRPGYSHCTTANNHNDPLTLSRVSWVWLIGVTSCKRHIIWPWWRPATLEVFWIRNSGSVLTNSIFTNVSCLRDWSQWAANHRAACCVHYMVH